MGDRTIVRRFPKTSLKAANLLHVEKRVGILKHAIEDDVEYLLVHFRSKPNHDFKDFDDLWNELHFKLIHFSCVKKEFRANYMNAFYGNVLDHFHSTSTIIKSGVIFALYFLYISQPTIWGKNRIRVSCKTWESLFNFYVESIKHGTYIEAALIFDKLRKLGAFLFVQEEDIDQYILQEKEEFEKPIKMLNQLKVFKLKMIKREPIDLCINNNELSEFNELAQKYQATKKILFSTPQATLATQRNLKETLNVTETRPRLLQNVLLTSTLAKDETETMKRIKGTCQQMWNSKRRKLQQEAKP